MGMQWRRSAFRCFLLCATALAFAGCHHEGGGIPGGGGTPTSSAFPGLTTSTSVTLNTGGGSVPLSSTGLAATLQYPSNNGGSGTFTLTTVAPALPGSPSGTPIVYGELVVTSNVNFSNYFSLSTVTLPTNLVTLTASNQVYESVYDQTSSTQLGSQITGSISGQTVTFGSIGSSAITANANDTYLFVISYQ
jgi:hypothetical protein